MEVVAIMSKHVLPRPPRIRQLHYGGYPIREVAILTILVNICIKLISYPPFQLFHGDEYDKTMMTTIIHDDDYHVGYNHDDHGTF